MLMKRILFILLLFLVFSLPVKAQTNDLYEEQLSASGASLLNEKLPADVRELLEQLHLERMDPAAYTSLDSSSIFRMLGTLLQKNAGGPLQAIGSLVAVVMLTAMFGGLENVTDNPSLRQTYHTVAVLACGGMLLSSFSGLLNAVKETVESVSVFMLSYVPTYGAILLAGGSMAGAVSYQTTLLTAAELLVQLIGRVVLPVLCVSLGLGCTGAVAEGFALDSLSQVLHKIILWVLGLFSTVFTGVLSIQQMVAAAGDTVGGRALKFSISSFVPVVGGALSEAYSTVVGCVGLLRSTVGCFGLVATVLILLPCVIQCLGWDICLQVGAGVAAMFHLTALEKLCKTVAGAVRVLIAVLAVFALLMIVSTSVLVTAAKS